MLPVRAAYHRIMHCEKMCNAAIRHQTVVIILTFPVNYDKADAVICNSLKSYFTFPAIVSASANYEGLGEMLMKSKSYVPTGVSHEQMNVSLAELIKKGFLFLKKTCIIANR